MSSTELTTDIDEQIDIIYKNKSVNISNALLQAREKASLFETKVELLAISKMGEKMEIVEKTDVKGNPYAVHMVKFKAQEINLICGNQKGNGVYRDILNAATEMKRKVYIIKDDTTNQFHITSLYGDVKFEKGTLTVEFNPETEKFFLELKKNFSKIRLDIAFKFSTNGGIQLYKLMRTHSYLLPKIDMDLPQESLPFIQKAYSLSELRLLLGYADLDNQKIRNEALKAVPDYDKLDTERKPKYKRWSDFYVRVILPGIKEINEISDIYIQGIDTKKGAHGKIEGVIIKMQHNKAFCAKDEKHGVAEEEKIVTMSPEDMMDFTDRMRDIIKENLKGKDLVSIAEAANFDMEKISKAYDVAKLSKTPINNLTGFLINAIKEDYSTVQKEDYETEEGRYAAEHREELNRIYKQYQDSKQTA